MAKKAFKLLLFVATFVVLSSYGLKTASAQTYSFDPASVTVLPGSSVVGEGLILPNLVIGTSGSNDVKYISTNSPYSPSGNAAYGANTGGVMNVHNACLPKLYGIADIGAGPESSPLTKIHNYVFELVNGVTAQNFNIQFVDWGDYLPFGACPGGQCAITATAYNGNGDVVSTATKSFTSNSAMVNQRPSVEYGPLSPAGDACEALDGQPGRFWFNLTGTGITRVTLSFDNTQSMDPNVAISDINYTLDSQLPVTPPVNPNSGNGGNNNSNNNSNNTTNNNGGNTNTGGSQVLGVSTTNTGATQVLGVSTMGETGSAKYRLATTLGLIGVVMFSVGIFAYLKNSYRI